MLWQKRANHTKQDINIDKIRMCSYFQPVTWVNAKEYEEN